MTLVAKLQDFFDRETRKKGQDYYWRHLVRIREGDSKSVVADVKGSIRYEASLNWDEPFLSAWCDCPYFQDNPCCKHLWGLVLAADAQGCLSEVVQAENVQWDDSSEDFDEDEDWDDDDDAVFELTPAPVKQQQKLAKPPDPGVWKRDLAFLLHENRGLASEPAPWPAKREIQYLIEAEPSTLSGNIVLSLETRDRKADGAFAQSSRLNMRASQLRTLPDGDRQIMSLLSGGLEYLGWGDSETYAHVKHTNLLQPTLAEALLPQIISTGRCYLRTQKRYPELSPLKWDDGEPWRLELEMKPRDITGWAISGFLRRGDERLNLKDLKMVTAHWAVHQDKICRLQPGTRNEWIGQMRKGPITASEKDGDELVAELLTSRGAPSLVVPDELAVEEVRPDMRPVLKIRGAKDSAIPKVNAQLLFDYGGHLAKFGERRRAIYIPEGRRLVHRDETGEAAAVTVLQELGAKQQNTRVFEENGLWSLHASKVPRVVRSLIEKGWQVEAEGKLFRKPGSYRMEVSSGVDWFELHGEVQYGDTTAGLPQLLEAVRRGESSVLLGDGSYGVLPEEWLSRIGLVAGLGTAENGHIRFKTNQAGLLDALLAAQPEVTCDESFARIREQMQRFEGVKAAEQPAGFIGQLRDYQREGLGWMQFLQRISCGGCLADDMGVGKTAQVLALLETRRELRGQGEKLGPALVVVPRSLIFNWKEEAARFTPKLKLLDHTGAERGEERFADYDVVLTTYGTLRRDAATLKDVAFDYLVLDEAQAVKNAGTESSKAVRLLNGAHRLALSGTPVENHLGELFSLFEFLNPGMLNSASVFKLAGGGTRNIGEDSLKMLAHALRPFILRRTKEQVARELPAKTEQTIYCEMKAPQRKLYNELRQHYRNTLLGKIDREGMGKSKIQVLEALLRLRQAACHPALIDAKRSGEASAKLDTLLSQLQEVLKEGHKALVFSQFTSLLKIVREHLDADKITYEYLDGATRDRQAAVERFQTDESCKLFLISLKAGGLGLNLTAAEYVFLLDPWWNPAVEAQAVDRAHRIGQTRQVFAYRLICRDTVEEKVLELQKSKRDLASAIISQDNSVIKNLQREDLELLLS